jgi:Arf-GAP/GTPase/ANK repeat/PH domain-containing protein 1/3
MMSLGNTTANKIWEAKTSNRTKPTPTSSREEKERWIRAKYEHKEFLAPLSGTPRAEQQLLDAVTKGDIVSVALILAHHSSSQQSNPTSVYNRDLKTPLHVAATNGSLAIVQLLIWHNADVKTIDSEGRTALYFAKKLSHKDVEELLKQQGCVDVTMSGSSEGSLSRRRGSLATIASKSDVLDKLPASDI